MLPDVDPAEIQNIVFDLGGVLYAIDPARTVAGLHALAGPGARLLTPEDPLFLALEMGTLDPAAFRNALRTALDSQASDDALDEAWNALLLGVIPGREEWVRQLAIRYSIVLLSNTNVIHQEVWGPQCAGMFSYMEQTYFSFDLHLRKPDPRIYQYVLDRKDWEASETLFVDDNAENVAAARSVGMHALHIDPQSPDQFSRFCLKFLGKV